MALQGRFWTISDDVTLDPRPKKKVPGKSISISLYVGVTFGSVSGISMKLFAPGAEKAQQCKSSVRLRNS